MKDSSILIAFITALLLHIIVGTVLLLNVNFPKLKTEPKNSAPIINASVINQKLFDDLAQRKSEKNQAEKKKVEQEKQRIQQEKKKAEALRKQKETKRIQAEKAETDRKKKEAQRIVAEKTLAVKQLKAKRDAEKAKQVADQKRKKQQAEKARKQAEEKRKKIEAEKIAAAKVAKAAASAKAKAEQEKERLRRAELDKQMDAQFEDTFSNAQSSRQLSEIARYTALIQDKISRNWQTEPSMKGKSCTLAIRTTADGLVISAQRSSGDIKLCESAKRAALKANTLPIPKDPDISPQFRDFDITLIPEF